VIRYANARERARERKWMRRGQREGGRGGGRGERFVVGQPKRREYWAMAGPHSH